MIEKKGHHLLQKDCEKLKSNRIWEELKIQIAHEWTYSNFITNHTEVGRGKNYLSNFRKQIMIIL